MTPAPAAVRALAARLGGLALAVRSGGVGWVGAPAGTLLLDLRDMRSVQVDPWHRTVHPGRGDLARCSAEEEPELFWAIRGAGHNFGTVVGLELDLIALDSVAFGMVWFDPDATTEGLAWCS